MRTLLVVFVAALATSAMGVSLLTSGNYAGHQYRLYGGSATYSDATNMAASLGAGWYVATTVTSAENAYVSTNLLAAHSGEFWFGLERNGPNSPSNFKWVTGEPYCYMNWNGGEPNGDGSFCGIYGGGGGTNGKWNDEGSASVSGFLLEYGPFYEASANYCCPDVLDQCNTIAATCSDVQTRYTALLPSCSADQVNVQPICDVVATIIPICQAEVTQCHQAHDASCTC